MGPEPMADSRAAFGNPNLLAQGRNRTPRDADPMRLADAMLGSMPIVGDVYGAASDAARYYSDPKSRSAANYALTLASLLPGIPRLQAKVWRGGKAPADGAFFSRDENYAKGFDKGDFRQYDIDAESALNMNKSYKSEHLSPIVDALRKAGDTRAASQIGDAIREDGGALGGHVYQWLERIGKNSPEEILRRAGLDAIDTGRDVVVLNKGAVKW